MRKNNLLKFVVFCLLSLLFSTAVSAQKNKNKTEQNVRTMTIPISIFTKQELKENQAEEFVQADRLIVNENKDEQTILSIKSVSSTPLSLAILIQDDLSSSFNLELKRIAEFIRSLPNGSRVMVAYMRGGKLDIREKFTDDLDEAAKSLRIVSSSAAAAPRSPYDGIADVIKRFESLPSGRRAILFVSDGLDLSNGTDFASTTQSLDLDRAILKAQRAGVAIYSFFSTATYTQNGNTTLSLFGQSALNRISDETGGRAFFQGSFSPVSFEPFFRDLGLLLNRQFALTYLSTHMDKGFHEVEVKSTNPQIEIEHPKGYFYRR